MKRQSAIEIQISARVALPRGWPMPSDDVLRAAVRRKAADPDSDIPGIELRIIRWTHGNGHEKSAKNTRDEWERFGRFLPAASVVIHASRKMGSR